MAVDTRIRFLLKDEPSSKTMNNLPYLLALNRMHKVGPKTAAILLERWPNLQEAFALSQVQLQKEGLPAWLAEHIATFDLHLIDEDLNWQNESPSHHLLSLDAKDYPPLLKEIPDPPIVLYLKGNLNALNQPTLAIVGSRNPTITGYENAKRFAKEIASKGVSIVSGLALGIDQNAHSGTLEAGGQTIAVLGSGIDSIYPQRHLKLSEEISKKGLLISEFPLKSPPSPGHFPRRNRIISGLSLCTLVIEAAIKSGSLITARMSMEQNRDVLAIPGSIHNPLARGCHYLLQQGAKLISSVADVLQELRIEPEPLITNKANLPLVKENENLVKFIGFERTSIDEIIVRSGYTVEQVLSELAELELLGTIVSVPGGYLRCSHER